MKSFKEFLTINEGRREDLINAVLAKIDNPEYKDILNNYKTSTTNDGYDKVVDLVKDAENWENPEAKEAAMALKNYLKRGGKPKNDETSNASSEEDLYNMAKKAKELADKDFESNSTEIANIENEIAEKTKNNEVKTAAEKAARSAESEAGQASIKTKALKESLRKKLGYVIKENEDVDAVVEVFERTFNFNSDDPGQNIISKIGILIDIYNKLGGISSSNIEECSRAICTAAKNDGKSEELSLDELSKIYNDDFVKTKKPELLAYTLFVTYLKTLDGNIFNSNGTIGYEKIISLLKKSNNSEAKLKSLENMKASLDTINSILSKIRLKKFDAKLKSKFDKFTNFNSVKSFVDSWLKGEFSKKENNTNTSSAENTNSTNNVSSSEGNDTSSGTSEGSTNSPENSPENSSEGSTSNSPSTSSSSSYSSNKTMIGWDVARPKAEDWAKDLGKADDWFDSVQQNFTDKVKKLTDEFVKKGEDHKAAIEKQGEENKAKDNEHNSRNNKEFGLSVTTEAMKRASFYNKTLINEKVGDAFRMGLRKIKNVPGHIKRGVEDGIEKGIDAISDGAKTLNNNVRSGAHALKNRAQLNLGFLRDIESSGAMNEKAKMIEGEINDVFQNLTNKYRSRIMSAMEKATSLKSSYERSRQGRLDFNSNVREYLIELDRKLVDIKRKYGPGFFKQLHDWRKEDRAEAKKAKENSWEGRRKQALKDYNANNIVKQFDALMSKNFTNDAEIIGKLGLFSRLFSAPRNAIRQHIFGKTGAKKYFITNSTDCKNGSLNYSHNDQLDIGNIIRGHCNAIPMDLLDSEEILEKVQTELKVSPELENEIKQFGNSINKYYNEIMNLQPGATIPEDVMSAAQKPGLEGAAARQALAMIHAVVENGALKGKSNAQQQSTKNDLKDLGKTILNTLAQKGKNALASLKLKAGVMVELSKLKAQDIENAVKEAGGNEQQAKEAAETLKGNEAQNNSDPYATARNNATKNGLSNQDAQEDMFEKGYSVKTSVTTANVDSTYPTKPNDKDYKNAMKQKITYKKGNYKYEKWF